MNQAYGAEDEMLRDILWEEARRHLPQLIALAQGKKADTIEHGHDLVAAMAVMILIEFKRQEQVAPIGMAGMN